jgi:hypothetical protein
LRTRLIRARLRLLSGRGCYHPVATLDSEFCAQSVSRSHYFFLMLIRCDCCLIRETTSRCSFQSTWVGLFSPVLSGLSYRRGIEPPTEVSANGFATTETHHVVFRINGLQLGGTLPSIAFWQSVLMFISPIREWNKADRKCAPNKQSAFFFRTQKSNVRYRARIAHLWFEWRTLEQL